MTDPAFGAVPDDGGDDTGAIQQAVNAARAVFFPAGRYVLSGVVCLPGGTRVVGNGSAVLVQTSSAHVFVAEGNPETMVHDVTVDSLSFEGSSALWKAALRVISGKNIVFQNSSALRIGLIDTDVWYPCDLDDREDTTVEEKECFGNKSTVRDDSLSDGIKVLNNRASGPGQVGEGDPREQNGVYVRYARNVEIRNNNIENYRTGITWMGGNGDPRFDGKMGERRPAKRFEIHWNTVTRTDTGIWGSRGDSIQVTNNTVSDCLDVCLDAEASNHVSFTSNTGRNAGSFVLAVFHFSHDVRFGWNTVEQDGSRGNVLFNTQNLTQDPANIAVWVHDNTFRYIAPSGVGSVGKQAANFLAFSNNRLENVVIDMRPLNSGGLSMTGNTLTFDRETGGRPAIAAGKNHEGNGQPADPVNAGWELEVAGNSIESSADQGWATGILVDQTSGEFQIDSWINGNTIRGFYPSIEIQRSREDKTFYIESNGHSAPIPSSDTNIVVRNNYWVYPLTPNPDGGGSSCDDPTVIIC